MNILGFNPNHNGSVCLLQDGEIKHFIQEDRLIRVKNNAYPLKSFIDIIQNYKIDFITWASPSIYYPMSSITRNFPLWQQIAWSYHPKVKYHDFSDHHHVAHISNAFYNSGFDEAIGIVIDGMGSLVSEENIRETESIYYCAYPANFKVLYQNKTKVRKDLSLARVYETITMHLGWRRLDAGKTMGLAPYGKPSPKIPPFFSTQQGNPDVFYVDYLAETPPWIPEGEFQETFINVKNYPSLNLQIDPREWHYDESKITDLEKDLAWKVQQETQNLVIDYVKKSIEKTHLKKVVCSGGYFLNCVTNYQLQKHFPDIEFYFDPLANDAGTAIGAAKLLHHHENKDCSIRPLQSLYLGKQYPKNELLEGIKKYT